MVHSAAGYVLTLNPQPSSKVFPRQVKLKGSIHFFLEKSWKFPQLEMIKKLIFSADKSYKKKLAYYKSLLNISKEFSFHFFTRPTSTIFLFHPLKSSFFFASKKDLPVRSWWSGLKKMMDCRIIGMQQSSKCARSLIKSWLKTNH